MSRKQGEKQETITQKSSGTQKGLGTTWIKTAQHDHKRQGYGANTLNREKTGNANGETSNKKSRKL